VTDYKWACEEILRELNKLSGLVDIDSIDSIVEVALLVSRLKKPTIYQVKYIGFDFNDDHDNYYLNKKKAYMIYSREKVALETGKSDWSEVTITEIEVK